MMRSLSLCLDLLLGLVAMSGVGLHAPSLPAAASVSITLSTDQTSIKSSSSISVSVVTTNITDHRVKIGFLPGPYESADLLVTVQVRDSRNRPMGKEELDKHACNDKPNCEVLFIASRYLEPGQSAKDHFSIDGKNYNLKEPGPYTIQIVMRDKVTDEVTSSNIVTFTVEQQ